jgi:hypothetical protein
MVRQPVADDVDLLADAASDVEFVNGGSRCLHHLMKPGRCLPNGGTCASPARGNLFGVFNPDGARLTGVFALWLIEEFVAEGGMESIRSQLAQDKRGRHGRDLANSPNVQMGILRVWGDVDPSTRTSRPHWLVGKCVGGRSPPTRRQRASPILLPLVPSRVDPRSR